VLSDALMQRVGGDNKFRRELEKWGRTQGIAKVDDNEFYQAVAKQIIYRLLVRILFYLTLQRQFRFLPELSISGLAGRQPAQLLKSFCACS
jgi:hypothetical protein